MALVVLALQKGDSGDPPPTLQMMTSAHFRYLGERSAIGRKATSIYVSPFLDLISLTNCVQVTRLDSWLNGEPRAMQMTKIGRYGDHVGVRGRDRVVYFLTPHPWSDVEQFQQPKFLPCTLLCSQSLSAMKSLR